MSDGLRPTFMGWTTGIAAGSEVRTEDGAAAGELLVRVEGGGFAVWGRVDAFAGVAGQYMLSHGRHGFKPSVIAGMGRARIGVGVALFAEVAPTFTHDIREGDFDVGLEASVNTWTTFHGLGVGYMVGVPDVSKPWSENYFHGVVVRLSPITRGR